MTHVGSRRMYLDPDVVPPLVGFRLYANLGVFQYVLSMPSVCIFETAHFFWSFCHSYSKLQQLRLRTNFFLFPASQ